jgi:hypothetical protein
MSMGRVLSRAIEAAGLAECRARVLSGAALGKDELAQLRAADLLLVAGLADEKRQHFHGDEVGIVARSRVHAPNVVVFDEAPSELGATGAELLRELALLRLTTAAEVSIAVSFDALGLELAQTALLFGADMLFGDLGGKRTLPLLEGPAARRVEIEGLVARSGRRARFIDGFETREQHA